MGRQAKHSPEVKAALAREYRALKALGKLPPGWMERKAAELKLHSYTVRRYIESVVEIVLAPSRAVPIVSRFDHWRAMRGGSR